MHDPTHDVLPLDPSLPAAPTVRPPAPTVRVIAVASGKGGVGKTNVTANLAVLLARRGLRVWVLDADLGLANLDIVYGVRPAHTLESVLRGERRLAGDAALEALSRHQARERRARGLRRPRAARDGMRFFLATAVIDALVVGALDVLLIDVAAGISTNVLYFAAAATETLVVTTPEPTAIADAYALIKVLATRWERRTFSVLVNMAANAADADAAFSRLASVAGQFPGVRMISAGWVPADPAVARAVRAQMPVALAAPGSPAAQALAAAADRLAATASVEVTGGLQFFFRRLIEGQA